MPVITLSANGFPGYDRDVEMMVPEGTSLETVVRAELVDRLGGRAAFGPLGASESRRGAVRFGYRGSLRSLCELRTAHAVYVVVPFAVPRPRALLGDQNLRLLLTHIDAVLSLWPVGTFQTLTLSAAGAESPVLSRLRDEIARRTGLSPDNGSGHLLLRLRRADTEAAGWEVLIRISPRPLAVRSWRVCDYKGALNAAVAHAMVLLTRPRPGDDEGPRSPGALRSGAVAVRFELTVGVNPHTLSRRAP